MNICRGLCRFAWMFFVTINAYGQAPAPPTIAAPGVQAETPASCPAPYEAALAWVADRKTGEGGSYNANSIDQPVCILPKEAPPAEAIAAAQTTPPPACPCTIWPATTVPATPDNIDTKPVELGVKFTASIAGDILGIRFYKGAHNTGTHIVNFWDNNGTLMATGTVTNETATGWQEFDFTNPIAIQSGHVYVASYFSPTGSFSFNRTYFTTATTNGYLQALIDGGAGGVNGAYTYGATSAFPASGFESSNYWIDVVFTGLPVITQQPIAQTVNNGSTATFTIVATGATSYQWTQNGVPIQGAINPNYSVVGTSGLSGSVYLCQVTNATGTVNSQSVKLTVTTIANGIDGGATNLTTTLPGYDILLKCQTGTQACYTRIANNSGPPTAIQVVVQTVVSHTVTLNWTASTTLGVSTYSVYRGAVSGGPYTSIGSTSAPTVTYVDQAVAPGSTYYYVVTAINPSSTPSESVYSNEAFATIPTP